MDWQRHASDYDDIYLTSPIYRGTLEKMTSLIGDDASLILDLGCGTGNVTMGIIKTHPKANVLAVDPSKPMREVATTRFDGLENVRVASGDALSIPAANNEFDYVVSNIALHHVPPGRRFDCATEIARVLKPGGAFVYADFFCNVEGGPGNLLWYMDVVARFTAYALDCLLHGAFKMMMLILHSIPPVLLAEEEHLDTEHAWISELESAHFHKIDVIQIPPKAARISIIYALKKETRNPGTSGA